MLSIKGKAEKMNRNIIYLVYYVPSKCLEDRVIYASVNYKIDYIVNVINDTNRHVTIISPSFSSKGKSKEINYIDNRGNDIHLPKSYVFKDKTLNRVYDRLYRKRFFKFALEYIKDGDIVFVYHSQWLMKIVNEIKKRRKIKVVYEVEEIYADVSNIKEMKDDEISFLKGHDAYIFPNPKLAEEIGVIDKPSLIVHGSYNLNNKERNEEKDKIRILYSGILYPSKGVIKAIESASYLSNKYELLITGYGNQKDIEIVKEKISEANKVNKCQIKYLGMKYGEEFLNVLANSDIGLCTQDIDASYNQTSFPSKILSYLGSNLRVVSVDIEAIRNSKVGELLYFYKSNDPKDIAETIKSINMKNKYNSKEFIKKLSNEFKTEIDSLLDSLKEQ